MHLQRRVFQQHAGLLIYDLHRMQINPASHRRVVLQRSFEQFRRDPLACLSSDTDVLSRLKYGWANEIGSGRWSS
jgi:hypothetical protein